MCINDSIQGSALLTRNRRCSQQYKLLMNCDLRGLRPSAVQPVVWSLSVAEWRCDLPCQAAVEAHTAAGDAEAEHESPQAMDAGVGSAIKLEGADILSQVKQGGPLAKHVTIDCVPGVDIT